MTGTMASRIAAFLAALTTSASVLADSESPVIVVSDRIRVTEPVDWPSGTAQGPMVLRLPEFGELFVAQCRGNGDLPEFGLRNGTPAARIDVLGVGALSVFPFGQADEDHVLEPGEEALLGSAITSTPNNVVLLSFQLGAGLGPNRRVATIAATGVGHVGSCRFQAQAVIHRL